jgi:hypothetical protein
VLWDGKTLYVASYRFVNDGLPAEPGFPTTMRRYSYDSTAKKYTLLGSTQINNSKVEVLTIDKDSTGRVWATWQQGNQIYLNVTATDGKTWGTPFPHPAPLSSVSVDDTSALIAFDGKMGVMWSRQVDDATDGMYWSYHVDGAANTDWSLAQAAASGQRSGDDHMNLKWLDSSGGRVFAAVKTSFTSASEPQIQLLALSGTTWTANTIATVSECPNRVIVLIDESTQMLRTFATYPKPSGTTNAGVCTSTGGAIYEKSTPLNNINFTTTKTARIVDADQYVHNVTSTKQNLNSTTRGTTNSGLLVLADANATSRYWHFYEPTGSSGGGGTTDTTPPTVTGTSPAAGATGVAVTANVTGTFSEAMDPSTVTPTTFTLSAGTTTVPATVGYEATGKVATLDPGVDLAAATTYTAAIKGGTSGVKDAAGNPLATDKTWTFTTAAAPPTGGTSETITLTATADSYVSSGATGTNYGTSTTLSVDADPVVVTYLKFDLSAYVGRTLESAALQLRSADNASGGKQNVKLVADDSWTEGGITYNNRPALGTSIGTLGPTTINTSYSLPLTVSGLASELGQQLSLGLDSSSTDGLLLTSKDAGSTVAPQLVLTLKK